MTEAWEKLACCGRCLMELNFDIIHGVGVQQQAANANSPLEFGGGNIKALKEGTSGITTLDIGHKQNKTLKNNSDEDDFYN